MKLSTHFSLHEFTRSDAADRNGIDNVPTDLKILDNLREAANLMQRIRMILGVPILISSGYRCPALNELVGGQSTSDHMQGLAVDFRAPAFGTPLAVCQKLVPYVDRLHIGQLIYENFAAQWVHVSVVTPKKKANRIITLSRDGAATGIVG